MNNKPKYKLIKNFLYAVDGLTHTVKSETSFRLELYIALIIFPAIYFMPFEFVFQLILFVTYFMIMIAELLNSAVENVVDLVTHDVHPLAKSAKDVGATAVLFTVVLHGLCWIFILYHTFFRSII